MILDIKEEPVDYEDELQMQEGFYDDDDDDDDDDNDDVDLNGSTGGLTDDLGNDNTEYDDEDIFVPQVSEKNVNSDESTDVS